MLEVYTDGSCIGNPGPGGWAAAAVESTWEISGGASHTTNNRMEMTAAIEALRECDARGVREARLWTDSSYLKQGITSWIHGWKTNGWKNSHGKPVKNEDLWKQIDALAALVRVEWRWVKAHSASRGHAMNEKVDRLAYAEAVKRKDIAA